MYSFVSTQGGIHSHKNNKDCSCKHITKLIMQCGLSFANASSSKTSVTAHRKIFGLAKLATPSARG